MRRLMLLVPVLALSTVAFARPSVVSWPAWLSIESPVNPYDPATRGAAFLIHAAVREGAPTLANLTGIGAPYEAPTAPDVELTEDLDVTAAAARVLLALPTIAR